MLHLDPQHEEALKWRRRAEKGNDKVGCSPANSSTSNAELMHCAGFDLPLQLPYAYVHEV